MPICERYWEDVEANRAASRASMRRYRQRLMECPIRAETYRQQQRARRAKAAERSPQCREECAKRLKKAEYMRNYFQARQAKKVKKVEAKVAQAGLNKAEFCGEFCGLS